MNSINTTDTAVASSPGANGLTLIFMCQLFGFMKEWLQDGGVSTENTMIYDNDTIAQKERKFSDADCDHYRWNTKFYGECVDNSMVYETNPKWLAGFISCITDHFMTEMGARDSCSDYSLRSDNDTNAKKTMTLSSTYRLFYTFMRDTLNASKHLSSYR